MYFLLITYSLQTAYYNIIYIWGFLSLTDVTLHADNRKKKVLIK